MASLGDAPARVQRIMGRPDEKHDGPSAAGGKMVWIFRNYSQPTGPREKTGWTEVLSPGVQDQRGHVVQEPVTRDIYSPQVGVDIQVIFTDGVVSSVGPLKR